MKNPLSGIKDKGMKQFISESLREEKKSAFMTAVTFDVIAAILIFCCQFSWGAGWITFADLGMTQNDLHVGVWSGCLGQYWSYYYPVTYWPPATYWYGYYWYWPTYWTGGCQYWWNVTYTTEIFGSSFLQALPSLNTVSLVLLMFCGCIALPSDIGAGIRRGFFLLSLIGTLLWFAAFIMTTYFVFTLRYYMPNTYWYVRGGFIVACIATAFEFCALLIKIWVAIPPSSAKIDQHRHAYENEEHQKKSAWAIWVPPAPAAKDVYTTTSPPGGYVTGTQDGSTAV